LSQSREVLPFGLNGGKAAQGGEQWIQKSDGTRQELSACEQTRLDAGDVFHLLTPGGGGFGSV
jgi:5-oxoprolinase (ATP-hydrolysing)